MYNGECYPNGSYFWDSTIKTKDNGIICVIPGSSHATIQWIKVQGNVPVICNNNDVNSFHCNFENGALGLFLPSSNLGLPKEKEGYYKCCLASHCSNNETNIVTVNVFSKKQIINYFFYIFCL